MFVDIDERLSHVMLTYAAVRGVAREDIERLAEEQWLEVVALDGFLPEEVQDLRGMDAIAGAQAAAPLDELLRSGKATWSWRCWPRTSAAVTKAARAATSATTRRSTSKPARPPRPRTRRRRTCCRGSGSCRSIRGDPRCGGPPSGPQVSMLPPGAPEFSVWFRQFSRSCFRLETLQCYGASGEDDSIRAFLAGQSPQPHPGKREWMALVGAGIRDGRTMQRVHVVIEPLTDYLRFEVAWSYAHSVAAGEEVRIISLAEGESWPPGVPMCDFWLFRRHR